MAVASWTRAVAATVAIVAVLAAAAADVDVEGEQIFFAFFDGVLQVVAQEHPFVVLIEVLVLESSAITIVIIAVVFVFSIVIKVAAGSMAAFDASAANADELYAASLNEGPSVHRSRTLAVVSAAVVSMAVAIIKVGHRVIIVEVPEAFYVAAIEAKATIDEALEEVAASTFSTVIIEEVIVVISLEVVAIALTNIAWVAAEDFAELKVEQGRASAGHSQVLTLTHRKDHLIRRRTPHHHSHLLRRSSHHHHRTTVNCSQYHQPKGLVRQFGRA